MTGDEAANLIGSDTDVEAVTRQGRVHSSGRVAAYCDAPMVLLIEPGGSQTWWRADLCRVMEGQ